MISIAVLLSMIFAFVFSQSDVNYYINCPIKKTHSYDTMAEAVEAAKHDGFDHNHFYICGDCPVEENLDLTYRAKVFGYDPTKDKDFDSNHTIIRTNRWSPVSKVNDQWTAEAKKRFVGMHDLADSLATEALGRFIIAPGLTINFHGLTQLSKVAFIPNSTVGFSVNFLDKKNPIGVFNCGFGSFSSIAYNKISFAGTELKIYDTFLAVNEFSASPKSLLVSGSIFSLGVGGNGNNPIVFANSTETSITSSYFTSDFPNDVGFVAINLKMRDNNWFGTSVRFYGQTKQIDLSNEFGYTF